MKDNIIDNEKSAVEYIQNILTKWDAFCIDHPKLTQALEMLLKIHQRKASEVAREIFEEIEEIFNKRIAFYTDMKKQPTLFFAEQYAETIITNCNIYLQEIAELKKKYTEGGE